MIEILARKKFGQVLQRHVKLPYSDWWLSQKDPFILAKHPEILDEVVVEEAAEIVVKPEKKVAKSKKTTTKSKSA